MKSGVWLLLIAMSLTPAVDGIAKGLGESYTPMFIAFLRYFGAGIVALAFAMVTRRRVHIPRSDYLGQVFRTALIMGAMTALIAALALVPLANAVGGFLIAPIVSTALSVVLMGEKLTAARTVGSVLSILGAAIIMRPEGSLDIGTVLALVGGTLLGCYLAATRAATSSADALSTLIVQCLLGSVMLAPFAFADGVPKMSMQIPVGMLGLGVLSACCHFLTVAAYRRSEASLLSPFLYFNMIAAVLVGFLWFGETPTMVSMLGLAGIAGGGLVAISPASALRQIWHWRHLRRVPVLLLGTDPTPGLGQSRGKNLWRGPARATVTNLRQNLEQSRGAYQRRVLEHWRGAHLQRFPVPSCGAYLRRDNVRQPDTYPWQGVAKKLGAYLWLFGSPASIGQNFAREPTQTMTS